MPEVKRAAAHIRKSDGAQQPLKEHLANVGKLSRRTAAKFGCAEAGELIGILHDLGKYSRAFQAYLGSAGGIIEPDADDYVDAAAVRGKVDHSSAGTQFIWNHLAQQSRDAGFVAQLLALTIASHHSGLIDCVRSTSSAPTANSFLERMGKNDQSTHLAEVRGAMDAEVFERSTAILGNPRLVQEVLRLLNSIKQANPSLTTRHVQFGLAVKMLFSCLVDADRVDSADFELSNRRNRGIDTPTEWDGLVDRFETAVKIPPVKPPSRPVGVARRSRGPVAV
jgi:CRISPR-associated endonuclease/helicase Cas3